MAREELTETDRRYMDLAFEHAHRALTLLEVPVGCIFVYDGGDVIAIGSNTVNVTKNATRHAEINCIDATITEYRGRFGKVDVYVTVEPCVMCMSALFAVRVRSIVFGCHNDRFGGRTVFDVRALLDDGIAESVSIKSGYRADEALELLKRFYGGVNPNAPVGKVKLVKKKMIEDGS